MTDMLIMTAPGIGELRPSHAVILRPHEARLRHERAHAKPCTLSAATGVDFVTTNFVVDTTMDRCPWSSPPT